MNFEIIEGRSSGSKLIVFQNFLYQHEGQKKSSKNNSFLRCRRFRSGCASRIIINERNAQVAGLEAHNHDEEFEEIGILCLRKRLFEAAEKSTVPLREVFDMVTADDPFGQLVTYPSLERIMRMRRSKIQPPNPANANEFFQLCEQFPAFGKYENEFFVKKHLELDDGQCIIMTTTRLINMLKDAREVIVDGTFKTVPSLFYQLLTLGSFRNGHVSLYMNMFDTYALIL